MYYFYLLVTQFSVGIITHALRPGSMDRSPGQGHAVALLVEALRYKPERRRFDSRWCHWNFSLT
jgi:hypothetical protein